MIVLRSFFARLRRDVPRREVIRGTADRVIRVTEPVPGVFREAIFLLREDYLRRDGGEQRLLREARQAAVEYLRRG